MQPRAGRSGVGLSLKIPSGRFRAIYRNGRLTPAGKYYYEQTEITPPGRFDFTQDAVRRGRSQYITLLDGTQKKITT